MRYKPTLFLSIELLDRINAVILPLEKSIDTLASHPALASSMKKVALHNLECLSTYKAYQHNLNLQEVKLMRPARY
jgi:hypothetical protein